MKLVILLTLACLQVSATAFSQQVTISETNAPLEKVLKSIRQQTGYGFFYSEDLLKQARPVTLKVKDTPLIQVLEECFTGQPLTYSISNKTIVIKERELRAVNKPVAPLTITGKVTDKAGGALPGVTVLLTGTSIGTVTDADGRFSLTVPNETGTLTVSFIGFVTQIISINGQKSINISLDTDQKALEEVIVVGYGTQKRITSVGAQAAVGTKELVQSPVANISNSLVGRLPGLFAVQASGEPGADQSRLLIRGTSTFSGASGPLILVDGIQVDNYNSIDPNEIESLTILKDAASTSVYGVRGANGVLLITTKRGKVGPPTVSYTFNQAINSFTNVREQMRSYDYATSFNQALKNDSYTKSTLYQPRFSDADIAKFQSGEDPIFFPDVNWYDVMLKKTSGQQQHNLNIRGGTDKAKYFISTGYFNQEGLFNNTDLDPDFDAQIRFKRYNFRSNLNYDITKRFRAALDFSAQIENRSGSNATVNSVFNTISGANPVQAPNLVDGKILSLLNNGGNNPISSLYSAGYKTDYRNLLNGTIRLEHDLDFITKGLTTYGFVAYQNSNRRLLVYTKPTIIYQAIREADNSIRYSQLGDDRPFTFTGSDPDRNRRATVELALNYKNTFGQHTLGGQAVYNQIKTVDPGYAFSVPNGYQNYVGRVTYDFDQRYLAEVSGNYNGTENFAPGKRFGFFPAGALGWVVTEENFFPKNPFVSYFKIRASYGASGNDQLNSNFLTDVNSRFLYRPTAFSATGPYTAAGGYPWGVIGSNLQTYPGLREGRGSSPDLTWERKVNANLGFDINAFKDKINFTAEIFNDRRDNILAVPQTVSGIIGQTLPAQNLGKMSNRGYELDLTFRDNFREANYWIKGNYSVAKNKIEFQDEIAKLFPYQYRTGQRFGQFFGLVADGLYNSWEEVNDPNRPVTTYFGGNKLQPGDVKYRDMNGDGQINVDDEVPLGYSNTPEIMYAMSAGGNWKNFDFSVLFQGADNVSHMYSRRAMQAFYDTNPVGANKYLLESWSQERYDQGLPINFPRLGIENAAGHNYLTSTFWLEDASYIRLKNMEVGYTLTPVFLNKIGLKSTRIYVNGNNLLTWSKMLKGVDPETPNLGANNEPYGLVRTFNAGINVNF